MTLACLRTQLARLSCGCMHHEYQMDAYNVGSVGAYACGKIHRRNTHAHTHASHCILARCSNRHVSSAELAAHYTFFLFIAQNCACPHAHSLCGLT